MQKLEKYFEQIEKELTFPQRVDHFQRLRFIAPPLRRWNSAAELKNLLVKAGGFSAIERDEVLRALLSLPEELSGYETRALIAFICRPILTALYYKCLKWKRDPEELWHDLVWRFLYVVTKIDVGKRPTSIAKKIFNDTYHDLYEECEKEWLYAKTVRLAPFEEMPEGRAEYLDELIDYMDYKSETKAESEATLSALKRLFDSDRLSEQDYLLLVATEVYGRTVASLTEENDRSFSALKKRRQRLLISLFEELPQKKSKKCPLDFETPPLVFLEGKKVALKKE